MVHYHNKFTETPEMVQEIKWKLINWALVGLVSGVLFAFIGGLIYAGVYGIKQNNNIATIYSFVLAAAVLLSWATIVPAKIASVLKGKATLSEIEIQFGDEFIKLITGSKEKQTSYKNIKNIKESKNYYLIIFENEEKLLSYLPVKKDSFLTQSDNFMDFINQKKSQNK